MTALEVVHHGHACGTTEDESLREFKIFGDYLRFRPEHSYAPESETEVKEILNRHRGDRIRAIGALHSWSEIAVNNSIVVDLRHFHQVNVHTEPDGRNVASIGAGCRVGDVLTQLRQNRGLSLPTYGMIGRQTMAGATATATHGSGDRSMSHYISEVRSAAYDPDSGEATIYEWKDGDALRAARCGLGCMGIVLSVKCECRAESLMEERFEQFKHVDDVLERENEYPFQQFYLVPWLWSWCAQSRDFVPRETRTAPSWYAFPLSLYRLIAIDFLFNGIVRLLAGGRLWRRLFPWFYKSIFPLLLPARLTVVDRASRLLIMHSELFGHIEMELFVPARHLRAALFVIQVVLKFCRGNSSEPADTTLLNFADIASVEDLELLRGSYIHHYPITVRRVLQDDALVSMTSGEESAWYAISLISYEQDTRAFGPVASALALFMARALGGRPHWGKYCPLSTAEIVKLYPHLGCFRNQCKRIDKDGVFQNEFMRSVLENV